MFTCPFETNDQLCHDLAPNLEDIVRHRDGQNNEIQSPRLPGCPRIQLNDPNVGNYLSNELQTPELNQFKPLWLVARQDSKFISSLTDQAVRGRTIVITEKPRLHLLWAYNRIFIKPLPVCLLSRPFWDYYLLSDSSPIESSMRQDLIKAANGFLRSYFYLVQHESDFVVAQDEKARLIPKGISYEDFARFTQLIHDHINDDHVSLRFHYGELPLARLNFYYKVFLLGFNYLKVEWQYSPQIARFYGPILFIFAILSVVLAAMQVVLAVEASDHTGVDLSYRTFSQFTLYFVLVVMAFLAIFILVFSGKEVTFAMKDGINRRAAKRKLRRHESN
ncbi:hypothetical protein ACHAPJ_008938 [Fusarium lateritium]